MVKYYTLVGNSFSKIREDLHAVLFLSNGAISKWMGCFKDGREATKDDKYTDRQKR